METSKLILLTIMVVCISISIYIICDLIYRIATHKREYQLRILQETNDVEKLKIYTDFDFDKIDIRINKLIEDAGNSYRMENFEYMNPDEIYLTEDIMNRMIRQMTKDVTKRITPAMMSLMKLSYNIENKDDLVEFLYEKIRMYVFNYSLEVNGEVEDI